MWYEDGELGGGIVKLREVKEREESFKKAVCVVIGWNVLGKFSTIRIEGRYWVLEVVVRIVVGRGL